MDGLPSRPVIGEAGIGGIISAAGSILGRVLSIGIGLTAMNTRFTGITGLTIAITIPGGITGTGVVGPGSGHLVTL